jgi:HAD superfamily hydrolase (TIGR01509 family)
MEVEGTASRRAVVRGVILDVDGTLVDSNEAHARAWVEALAEAGHEVEFAQVRDLIGKGGDKLLPEVSGVEEESEQGQALSERRAELFKERYLPEIKPFPQTRELVERMRAEGIRVVVASSAQKGELGPLLETAQVSDLVESATSSSDAENSKPDPDIVAAALEKLGLRPEEVLMLGDTPYDIEAAAGANVPTIALRCGGWGDAELDGALAIYDDPAELLARFDQSPFVQTSHAGRE